MKKINEWIRNVRVFFAQWQADMIIFRLESCEGEKEFDSLIEQGTYLNAKMVIYYDIYLD